ncbi:MAG: MFS transporter [Rhodospirillaceae bacterium]|jgi:MFS family permease|nr:MFS transporter [Rhodospirillaceae bacterium]
MSAPQVSGQTTRRAWLVWAPAALFFALVFFQRTAPGVMVEELMRDFSVGAALLGNLAAFYFYAYASVQLGVGLVLDNWGPRRVLTGAALVAAAGAVVFALAESLHAAYLGRLLIGLGCAFGWIGCLTVIGQWFPARRFATVAGLSGMVGMVGAMLAQTPLAALLAFVSWRTAMLGVAGASFAAALLCWFLLRDRNPARAAERAAAEGHRMGLLAGLRAAAANRQVWPIALFTSTNVVPFIALVALWGVPYMMRAHGIERGEAAFAVVLILLGQGLGSPAMGWLSDRIGRRKPVMALCTGLALVTFCIAVYIPGLPLWLVYAVLFVHGIGSSGIIIGFSTMREAAAPHLVGASLGIVNTFVMGFSALIHPLLGLLLDLAWDGRMENGVRYYGTGDYERAMLVLPATLVVGLIAAALVRETWCGEAPAGATARS